jgi:hypothetical protein
MPCDILLDHMVVSHGCIVIDVVKPQWRHAYCRAPIDGPSDVISPVHVTLLWCYRIIAPIGVTSSHHLRLQRDVTAELWVLNFWIKFAMIWAQNASKCSHLVSCDKQKTVLVCFFSGNITLMVFFAWKTHSTCGLAVSWPRTTRVIFPLKKHTRAVFLLDFPCKMSD